MSDLHDSADQRRRDYIVGALKLQGAMYEGDARAYLAEHDAAHRAEALAEAVAFLIEIGTPITGERTEHERGVMYAARRLTERSANAATEKASTTVPTATPDFFQPGHTYQRRRWHFQCLATAPNPFNGETRAVGYLFRPGEPATATALDPDDWEHGKWTEQTEDGA